MPQILVIEDEADIRALIVMQLRRDGHQVDEASDGNAALQKITTNSYALAIVDWMLPGLSGLEIIKEVRRLHSLKKLGILMVTAKSAESDIILGLESGADDYVVKPFELSILAARVRAILRRVEQLNGAPSKLIQIDGLEINPEAHEAKCNGEILQLTPFEFKVLFTLAENRGRVLTRENLIRQVQGEGVAVVERAIDTHVFGLRKKLNMCSEIIETVRGVGYRISAAKA